jgi:hypothetical protein
MNIIKLNVGGRIFESTYDTLVKIPYFKNMFDGCDEELFNDPIFVNRSSLVFEHVFALIIDPLHSYPKSYLYELDFYGIDYSDVRFDNEEIMTCLKNQKVTINIMSQEINDLKYKISSIKNNMSSSSYAVHDPYNGYRGGLGSGPFGGGLGSGPFGGGLGSNPFVTHTNSKQY